MPIRKKCGRGIGIIPREPPKTNVNHQRPTRTTKDHREPPNTHVNNHRPTRTTKDPCEPPKTIVNHQIPT
ncbi:hypothetical protein J6590_023526 [Homalodisca vitripennis]|nr:hypothetical protein J6590_023526 [Homalodisca vitripennis]